MGHYQYCLVNVVRLCELALAQLPNLQQLAPHLHLRELATQSSNFPRFRIGAMGRLGR